MERLLVLIAILFAAIGLHADCTFRGIWMWPSNDSINANGIVIIEGYASDREHVKNIAVKYPAYLLSANHKVLLQVLDYNEGGMLLNQVVLKPSELLMTGETYELVIDGLDVSKFGYSGKGIGVTKKWQVKSTIDTTAPVFISYPIEKYKSYVAYGCGPAISVNFHCTVTDDSACLVKAQVKHKKTGRVVTYYLKIRDGEISVGHGMCTGEFDLELGDSYEVVFQLMDASGNLGMAIDKSIAFIAPQEEGIRIFPKY